MILDTLPEVGRRAPWVPEEHWRDLLDKLDGTGPGLRSVVLDGPGTLAVQLYFDGRESPAA